MANGLDTTQVHDAAAKASALKAKGIDFVCGYLFVPGTSSYKQLLDKPSALALSKSGIYVVSVFESGRPNHLGYFTPSQGNSDGAHAASLAVAAGQPADTPIYCAIDMDVPASAMQTILDYFEAFRAQVKASGYVAAPYGSGIVCHALVQAGFATYTWLSGSSGWAGYSDWQPHCSLLQTTMDSQVLGIPCDGDTSDGSAGGWKVSPC